MATRKKPSRRIPSNPEDTIGFKAENFDAAYFTGVPPYVIAAERQMEGWNQNRINTLFLRNRELLKAENPFVLAWHRIRSALFNDGFCFPGAADATTQWADRSGLMEMMQRLNNDVWNEWLLNDNAIVFWIEPEGRQLPKPIVLDTEICNYNATIFGATLSIKVPQRKLSPKESESLSPRWRNAYASGSTITLDPEEGERFKVLKRSKVGDGLATPRLYCAYRLLRTLGHLHISDGNGAFHSRDVARVISVGRDMKFADALKQPMYFTLTKAEKQQIEKMMKTIRGAYNLTVDSKVKIDWQFMNPKFFEASKYKGTLEQLNLWGGPGMQLLSTGQAWLVPFFAAEGRSDRSDVGMLLDGLLADPSFLKIKGVPKHRLKVGWNPSSFNDAALVLQRVQFAASQGVASIQTLRDVLGFGNEKESERLAAEKKKPESYVPGFEQKQGMLSGPVGRPTDPHFGDGGG